MPKTLMRGLALLETIDLYGPMTIMELARRAGIDKSIVSRTVSALEEDGWISRSDGKVELGPRAALLGHSSPGAEAVRKAELLVHAVAGVTGMLTQAYGLVGGRAVVFAAAGGRGQSTPVGLGTDVPLFATAAGLVVASQLQSAELDRRLPPEPYPDPAEELSSLAGYPPIASALGATGDALANSSVAARTRDQLDPQLATVRRQKVAVDKGQFHPQMGCIAVPWPQPGVPAALACMGTPSDLLKADTIVRGALAAAAATGASPEDVVAKAGAVLRSASGE
jgi:DNA-binding IclR family transcriptional regulator